MKEVVCRECGFASTCPLDFQGVVLLKKDCKVITVCMDCFSNMVSNPKWRELYSTDLRRARQEAVAV